MRDRKVCPRLSPFLLAVVCVFSVATTSAAQQVDPDRAQQELNVLWIIGEDLGPELACYGHPAVRTPNLDQLAAEGVRFTRAFAPAPVCSVSRSGFMTGMEPVSIGAHNHRSHRKDGYMLPAGVKLLTAWLKPAGVYTANLRELFDLDDGQKVKGTGKTDWNFKVAGKAFDGKRWSDLPRDRPFFAQVNFSETHRGGAWNAAHKRIAEPADPQLVALPPYYPDLPAVRADWAQYLNALMALDRWVGGILDHLEQDGLAQNTIVIFFGDHGRAMVRGKQWPYDSGLHVPLIVRWPKGSEPPEGLAAGGVDERLVSLIDVSATTLSFLGTDKPEGMQGRVLFGENREPDREYVYATRDRCDGTVFNIRTVRDTRYRYIRNGMPERPFLQLNCYKEWSYPVLGLMRELHAAGKLDEHQARLFAPSRAKEELYDTLADPYETVNLAADPNRAGDMQRLRGALDKWMDETGASQLEPEDSAIIASWQKQMKERYAERLAGREAGKSK